mmetsp:Transcript_24075/g.40909  ORF Transcript_24075/g.40909 Transcript_24075/m.40909 type:complete len:110 (+) Transcript_24075:100-429(+)
MTPDWYHRSIASFQGLHARRTWTVAPTIVMTLLAFAWYLLPLDWVSITGRNLDNHWVGHPMAIGSDTQDREQNKTKQNKAQQNSFLLCTVLQSDVIHNWHHAVLHQLQG